MRRRWWHRKEGRKEGRREEGDPLDPRLAERGGAGRMVERGQIAGSRTGNADINVATVLGASSRNLVWIFCQNLAQPMNSSWFVLHLANSHQLSLSNFTLKANPVKI